ncbi:helix-turn-helix domain-containing protein [Agromyces neolithicus]
MLGDADLATPARLMGEPARAAMLLALLDGRALPASDLAGIAGVKPSTASAHLAQLVEAGSSSAAGSVATITSRLRDQRWRTPSKRCSCSHREAR